MHRPGLSAERLLRAGFKEVGCWILNSARDLRHTAVLPARSGVYAFAIDGVVQYVGLASKSLRQRLGFYRKPGASQRTNVRLNHIIRGHIEKGTKVQILIAQPPNHEWQGFKISGAEGLEAGLIEEFNLPWNMRGAVPIASALNAPSPEARKRQRSVADQIVDLIQRRPGMTELEIAKALYGTSAVQQDVNQDCRMLVNLGLVERLGVGGRGDPYTYRATQKLLDLNADGVRSRWSCAAGVSGGRAPPGRRGRGLPRRKSGSAVEAAKANHRARLWCSPSSASHSCRF